ncbi:MAG: ATP-binding protein [Gemmatimonadaceae bacterium]|nr:ATP-binding protein [Gemmatimonadaceae bacterium]
MTLRVVLTGPEASGKTTLARTLADALAAPCVPEASRLVAEALRPEGLSAETVAPIAQLGMRLDDEARLREPDVIVYDTDLVSTVVYARHYYGEVASWIVDEARARRADLYLLCRPDLPWTPDGVRDRPTGREAMFDAFRDALTELGARVVEIGGVGEARTEAARAAVEAARAGK